MAKTLESIMCRIYKLANLDVNVSALA